MVAVSAIELFTTYLDVVVIVFLLCGKQDNELVHLRNLFLRKMLVRLL
jgi:hypothetical protein